MGFLDNFAGVARGFLEGSYRISRQFREKFLEKSLGGVPREIHIEKFLEEFL